MCAPEDDEENNDDEVDDIYSHSCDFPPIENPPGEENSEMAQQLH